VWASLARSAVALLPHQSNATAPNATAALGPQKVVMPHRSPRRAHLALPILLLATWFISACGGSTDDAPVAPPPRATRVADDATPQPPQQNIPVRGAAADSWLIMLYANADDEVLEYDIFTDVNEMELIGSDERITLVVQLDRYEGAFDGDGDWTGTRRYVLQQDDDLGTIASPVVEDLGEANMADGATLVDFATWAIQTFPAEHQVLILSDHGMGWPGGWNDPDPPVAGPDGLELTSNGDLLLLDEIDAALADIRSTTGIERFALVGFDACLMGHLEVAAAVAPHADVMVASQELEPALGWAYASFLSALRDDPAMDARQLGAAIVATYIDQDIRIIDDAARAEFIGGFFGGEPDVSAAQVAADLSGDITLSAYDLSTMPAFLGAFDRFVEALSETDQRSVAQARSYAQKFENVFDSESASPYLDLAHFAELSANESGNAAVTDAFGALADQFGAMIIANRRGDARPAANGVSIYFPESSIYDLEVAGPASYTTVARRFAEDTRWDDFLAFHYFGTPLGETLADDAPISAPGAGGIAVSPLRLSESVINIAGSTTLAAEVSGANIGFIYAFTGFYNADDDTLIVIDREYIDAGQSKTLGGINYPDWGDEPLVEIEFDWEPLLYGIDDGQGGVVFALLDPQDYGATGESATYSVSGEYQPQNGNPRAASLYFRDGELISIVGFAGGTIGAGAPRAITPSPGDAFVIFTHVYDMKSDDPDAEPEYRTEPGDTLVFGDVAWSVTELQAPAGDYVLGIQAEDLDGNLVEQYDTVTVEE